MSLFFHGRNGCSHHYFLSRSESEDYFCFRKSLEVQANNAQSQAFVAGKLASSVLSHLKLTALLAKRSPVDMASILLLDSKAIAVIDGIRDHLSSPNKIIAIGQ